MVEVPQKPTGNIFTLFIEVLFIAILLFVVVAVSWNMVYPIFLEFWANYSWVATWVGIFSLVIAGALMIFVANTFNSSANIQSSLQIVIPPLLIACLFVALGISILSQNLTFFIISMFGSFSLIALVAYVKKLGL